MHTLYRWIRCSFMRWSWLILWALRLAHRLNSLACSHWVASLSQRNRVISLLDLTNFAAPQAFNLLFHLCMRNFSNIYLTFWRALLILNVFAELRIGTSVLLRSILPVINLHNAIVARIDGTKVAYSVQSLLILSIEGGKMLGVSCLLHVRLVIVSNNALGVNLNRELLVGSLLIWRMLVI